MNNRQLVTFEVDTLLLKAAQEKAACDNMELDEVLHRLLTLWYYDTISFPEPPRGGQPMTDELWAEMQVEGSPWESDEEFELFLEWLRQERGHPPADDAARERRARLAQMFTEPRERRDEKRPATVVELQHAMAEA